MSGTSSDESEVDEKTLGLDFVDGVDLDYMRKREGKLNAKQ